MEPIIQATLLHTIAGLANAYYVEAVGGASPLAALLLSLAVLRLLSQKMWKEKDRKWWVSNGLLPFLLVFLAAWTIMLNI